MCTLYSFFSPRPSAVGYIVQPHTCHIIEHIFVPTRSVEGNIEKIRFSWVSNSKFVIFPQIYPCSNYKIFPNVPLLFPVSNGDSPVVTTFPRSNYRGFLTTGESYCTMYTLCIVRLSVQRIQMIDKKYFICEICGKVFTRASNLASILSPPWEEIINWPQLVSIVAPVWS